MYQELFFAYSLFAVVSSITPGPNNTMMLASGLNFGFVRSLRHVLGIGIGFGIMLLAVGLGLHAVLARFPVVFDLLRIAGGIYMLWLAWKLAHSGPVQGALGGSDQPMGFFAAAAFQWVNPKAWVMAVTAMSSYLPPQASPAEVALLAAVFVLFNLPCVSLWAGFGHAMRALLQNPKSLRAFNITMALALVASLVPMLSLPGGTWRP